MMNFRLSLRAALCAVALSSVLLGACKSNPDRDSKRSKDEIAKDNVQLSEAELRQEADKLYRQAHQSLESADYADAVTKYDKLIARYPFSDYGTQGEMERVFAQYKNYQHDDASSAADRFLRDHPRHIHADYVQYLKGLIDSDRSSSLMSYLPIQTSKADVANERQAFNDFQVLIQKYPNSRYIGDARKRMIFLRDRVAMHELSVVQYYYRRGAFIAAAKRADELLADFPGAPATAEALKLQQLCYKAAGLETGVTETGKLLAANPNIDKPVSEPTEADLVKNSPQLLAAAQAAVAPNAPPAMKIGTQPALNAAPQPPVAAPAAAAATPAPVAAPATDAQQPKESHGFFSWFSGLFSIFDTTRPENSYTVVIPTSTAPAADASTAGAATGAATSPAQGTTHTLSGNGIHATIGPDAADQWHPVDGGKADTAPSAATPAATPATSPAPTTSAAPTAAPAATSTTAATPTPPPAQATPGFFSRLGASIRSVFDRDRPSVDNPEATPAK